METTDVQIFDTSDPIGKECFKDIFELWQESIRDHIKTGKYEILVRNSTFAYKYDEKEDMFHGALLKHRGCKYCDSFCYNKWS